MHPNFQGSTIYNSQDTESTKMSSDRKMKTTWYIYKLEYYSVKNRKNNDFDSSIDVPWNYHTK